MKRETVLASGILIMAAALAVILYRTSFQEPTLVTARAISLVDGKGNQRALIATSEDDGSVGIVLYDRENRQRATIGLSCDGDPAIVLRDKEDKIVWSANKPSPTTGGSPK